MVVFKLRQPGHHQGDMLVVMEENANELKTEMAENAPMGQNVQDDVSVISSRMCGVCYSRRAWMCAGAPLLEIQAVHCWNFWVVFRRRHSGHHQDHVLVVMVDNADKYRQTQ